MSAPPPRDPAIRAAVLVASDRCARGEQEDRSGPAVTALLRSRLGAEIVDARVLPDDLDSIAACFAEWARTRPAIDLAVSTGGTGLSPRDVTPEAAARIIERPHPALLELARARCRERSPDRSPRAYLSRGVAGTAGRTLILTLPGSTTGAVEMLEALLDLLPHSVSILRGSAADHAEAP